MTNEYRVKAAQFAARARREADPARRAQFESLERSYLRLAVLADKNAGTDLVYETPPWPRVVQQQQQYQAKKKPPH